MRGQQIFSTLFDLPPVATKEQGKGRNLDLDAQRNELLLHRYYFYGKFTGLRYSLTLNKLSDEFFLSQRRIQDIIQDSGKELHTIRELSPSLSDLKEKWPHLVWK